MGSVRAVTPQTSGSLPDSGPVAFSSGGKHTVQREFQHAFSYLSAAGATLVSLEPPMWVLDGCQEVEDFVRFAEQELAGNPGGAWDDLGSPGGYTVQERYGIPKADANGLRDELRPLDALIQSLAGTEGGFLKAVTGWDETVPIKRYRHGPTDVPLEAVKTGEEEEVLPLERVHIDRNRNAEDAEGYRKPMRLTLIMSYDETGGTYFPYAELLQECPGVEPLPTVLDKRSTTNSGAGKTWPIQGGGGRGVLVRGRRGRLLVFASSSEDRKVPLYSSLHQGVLLRRPGTEGSMVTRMISVIGTHGDDQYETSGTHECIEHETIETRAGFFGRTVEEEALGILMTPGSTRRGEAQQFLEERARLRATTVQAIIAEELRRNPTLAEPLVPPSAYVAPDDPVDEEVPRIFWKETCNVCLGKLLQPRGLMHPEYLEPGYISCGHIMCKICHDEIARHIYGGRAGRTICPECRTLSRYTWRPLIVDGKWVTEQGGEGGGGTPGDPSASSRPTYSGSRTNLPSPQQDRPGLLRSLADSLLQMLNERLWGR